MRNLRDRMTARTFVSTIAAMLGAIGMASCMVTPQVSIRSRAYLEMAPVERLLVYARIKSRFFDDSMYRGFYQGMARLLASCRVESKILHNTPLALDEPERLRQTMEALRPNAILTVESQGGVFNSDQHQTSFSMVIKDTASGHLTWMGDGTLTASTGDHAAGWKFAAEIISHLREDGVLTRCPAGDLFQGSYREASGWIPHGSRWARGQSMWTGADRSAWSASDRLRFERTP